MIYEVRTYRLKPGSIAECEKRFAEALPHREKYSPLGAFWHTDIGPLNRIIHVWPYDDLRQRTELRGQAMGDPNWPPKIGEMIEDMESEIFIPAPFMQPLGQRSLGGVYEMRTVPARTELSPLAECWYTEIGGLNKFVHIWPYADLEERARIRAESLTLPNWPPGTREFLVSQDSTILIPAAFSPMH